MTTREQLRYWGIGLLAAGVAIWLLSSVMLPFVAGMAVAYFLDPIVDRLETWRISRTAGTTLILLLFFLAVILLLLLIVPVLQSQVVGFIERLPAYIALARDTVLPALAEALDRIGIDLQADLRDALAGVAGDVVGVVGRIVQQAWSGGLAFFNIISLLVITPIVSFYLLRDFDRIVDRIDAWLPRQHADEIRKIGTQIDDVMAGFVRGQGTVCLILGTFYGAALSLAGLEFGLIIGIIAGLLSFIPFVGAVLGLLLSIVPAITQFWPDYLQIGLIVAIFAAGQFLEGNFLTPRLLGGRIGLHPVWVMFALLAGGALFGFVGVLLAVPIAAAVGVLVRYFLEQYLSSRLYLGPGPPPQDDD